jgi:2,3-dihydroxybenzoate decarboxylase
LNVPFYLHPRSAAGPGADVRRPPWLRGASWAFGVEAATHALRLMASGIFDTHPA